MSIFSPGALCPGQYGKPLDIVAGERVVGSHGRHTAKPIQFLHRFFLHIVGHACSFDLFAQVVHFALALVLLAQFFLNGLHLFAQVVIPLRLLDLILYLALNLGAQLLHLKLLGQVFIQLLEPGLNRGCFKKLLLIVGSQERQGGSNEIHQAAGILDIRGNGPEFIRESRRLGDDLLELPDDIPHQRFDAGIGFGMTVFKLLDLRHHERLCLDVAEQPHAADAFGKHETALVGHPHNLVHGSQSADFVHIRGFRRIQPRVELRGHDNGAFFPQRFDQLDGALTSNCKRQNSMREEDRVANGKDGDAPRSCCCRRCCRR